MNKIELHLELVFSEAIKPADAAAFAKAAIESGYMTVAGHDDEQIADAADAFDEATVGPLPLSKPATVSAAKTEVKTSVVEPGQDSAVVDLETLKTLMHAAHYHTEDLQELEDEGMLKNDSQHKAHMRSLNDAINIACNKLGVRRPKSI